MMNRVPAATTAGLPLRRRNAGFKWRPTVSITYALPVRCGSALIGASSGAGAGFRKSPARSAPIGRPNRQRDRSG